MLFRSQRTESFTKAVRDVGNGRAAAALLTERERRGLAEIEAGRR